MSSKMIKTPSKDYSNKDKSFIKSKTSIGSSDMGL